MQTVRSKAIVIRLNRQKCWSWTYQVGIGGTEGLTRNTHLPRLPRRGPSWTSRRPSTRPQAVRGQSRMLFPLRTGVELFSDPAMSAAVARAKQAAILYDEVVFETELYEVSIAEIGLARSLSSVCSHPLADGIVGMAPPSSRLPGAACASPTRRGACARSSSLGSARWRLPPAPTPQRCVR